MDWIRSSDSLHEYWRMLVRRRWVVYLAVIGCVLGAFVLSALGTPLYRATATVQIERQSPDVLNMRDVSTIDYSWMAYGDFYQTQYRIVGSEAVAERAVDRLGLTDHPDLSPENGPGGGPSPLAKVKGWVRSLLPSRATEIEPPTPEEMAASWVMGGLEVSPVRNSQLVRISWVGEEPSLTADIANAVSRSYIQYNLESQFTTTEAAGEFLLRQIANLKREIVDSERELQDYREAKSILTIQDENNTTLQALRDLSAQATVARAALAQAEARWSAVRDAPSDGLPEVLNSQLIQRLRQDYAAYEAEYSSTAKRFKEDWPGLVTLRSKLDQTESRLATETDQIAGQVRAAAEADFAKARNEVDNLDALLSNQQRAAQLQRRDAVEFINLEADVAKKRETLDALMQRQNEMALSMELKSLNSASTNVRIVEEARVPLAPFRPNTSINLLIGAMLGLALGVGLAFGLDYVDNTISSPTEVERLLSLPTLAIIPRQLPTPGETGPLPPLDLISYSDPRSPASEAYRELRTAILLSHAGEPPRQMMITSAEPEEGKSSTALNLAITLAQLGQRVLIVDTDLRKPRLHKVFGMENGSGVSTYLSGLTDTVAPLTLESEVENLDILCSGPIPPNPSELLNSPRFSDMGRELLSTGYEHVVYDSAPLLAVSDPVIIANRVETTILVVRAGKTTRQALRIAADKLRQTSKGAAGVVLNGADLDALGAQQYYYYGESQPVRPQRPAKRRRFGVGSSRA